MEVESHVCRGAWSSEGPCHPLPRLFKRLSSLLPAYQLGFTQTSGQVGPTNPSAH